MRGSLQAGLRTICLPLVRWAAQTYVAGPQVGDALRVCRRAARRGFKGALGFWNDDGDAPRAVADVHLAAIEGLAREPAGGWVSVKLPALGYSRDLLEEVMARSLALGVGLHFDSLGPETTDRTWAMIARACTPSAPPGCTLPGRWRRSLRDAERAIELGLPVRVVKGQWTSRDGDDLPPRDGFLSVVDRLAGRARHVLVATHDRALATEALRRLRAAGTSCELELLFGLPLGAGTRAAAKAGVPVRIYIPYGHAWLPYCLSQARQDPRVCWWFARDLLQGRAAL